MDPGLWHQLKDGVELASGWPPASLHLVFGVIAQLLFAALMKTSLADFRPWVLVLLLELVNEAYDFWFERWPLLAQQAVEGASDLGATMLLPSLLLLVARYRPELMVGPK